MSAEQKPRPQFLADLIISSIRTDASDTPMRECNQNALRTFFTYTSVSKGCPHKMVAALFSINDLSINNLPLLLLNVNVLCASYRQEFPFNVKVASSHQTIRRVRSRLAKLVQHAKRSRQQFPAVPFVWGVLLAKEPTSCGFSFCDNFSFPSELTIFTPVDS